MSYFFSNGEWAKQKAGVVIQRLLPRLKWAKKLLQQLSHKAVQKLSDVRASKPPRG